MHFDHNPYHPEASTGAGREALQASHDAWQKGWDEALEPISQGIFDNNRDYHEGRASRRERVELIEARSQMIEKDLSYRRGYILHLTYVLGDGSRCDIRDHHRLQRDAKTFLATLPAAPIHPTWYDSATGSTHVALNLARIAG